MTPFTQANKDIAASEIKITNAGNTPINKAVLYAYLQVDDRATSLWEELHTPRESETRPTMFEHTNGVKHDKNVIGFKLLAVADEIKNQVDLSLFSVNHVGAEAAHLMSDITPSTASFKDPDELFAIRTQYINHHDILKSRIDQSGSSAEEGSLARRVKCFDSFIGAEGRGKNLGVFACFIIWENKSPRFITKRLPPNISQSSAAGISSPNASSTASSTAPQNMPNSNDSKKKQKSKTTMFVEAIQNISENSNPNLVVVQSEEQKQLTITKIDVAISQKRINEETISTMQITKLQKLLDDGVFAGDTAKENSIKDKIFKLAMEECDK